MTTSLVAADSLLAIDVGTITTRAVLFDVVEGRYRFLALGSAPTTAGAPFNNISEGVLNALRELQTVTGRNLLGGEEGLVIPSQPDGSGVDACVATMSVGPPVKVVAVGLLEGVSAESAQNLATTTYARVVETMSLNDRRQAAPRIDAILRVRPDLIVVAGGTEGGASKSVMGLLDPVGLACYLTPKEQRPVVLFAGNSSLAGEVKSLLGELVPLHIAPNVRPTLDIEQLTPAQRQLTEVYRQVRSRQIYGVQEVDSWARGRLMPTATAFGRTIRFLSQEYATRSNKGVLGVDVGASATTVASAFAGDLILSVDTRLGVGESLPGLLGAGPVDDIVRWIPQEVSEDYVRDYIYNKALFPAILPTTAEELAIEQALVCQALHLAITRVSKKFPASAARSAAQLLPWFEPIVATGSALVKAPKPSQSLMVLLNALQPTGVTTIALDRIHLAAALGAAAEVNPLLMIQSLDASNFVNLCTVVSPVGQANFGTPILRVRVTYANGSESKVEVRYGSLEVIKLSRGQSANLHLQPLHGFDVGMGGLGRGGSVRVTGGLLGVVIDARGRPLRLPPDPGQRRELIGKWQMTLDA